MIRKDIILRWTQELAKVIARLMGKETIEALQIIRDSIFRQLELDPGQLDQIPKESLIEFLTNEKGLHIGQLEFLAELLARQSTLLYKSGDFAQSRRKLEKALIIFEHIEKEQTVFSFERLSKLKEMKQLLRQMGETNTDS